MKLSTRARYGIRAMVMIATNRGQSPIDLNVIAKEQGISKKYLHALLVQLKRAGMLESIRGKSGGYRLAKKPDEITLLEVYEALEGNIDLVDCLIDEARCARARNCLARNIWQRLSNAMRKELSSVTLADVVCNFYGATDGCYEI
ncbi:MAG: Rrf2 family transcriptional regulator [Spirochaetes bacterium]|nr:Rrf2 family transcriptional regulator [Spirochaetota bacterium]